MTSETENQELREAVINLLADIRYGIINPRVRYE